MSLPVETHFFPAGSHLPVNIWATKLDKIRISGCDPMGNQGHVCISLIGPDGHALHLHLAPPLDQNPVAEMETLGYTIYQDNSDLELFEWNESTRFDDVCVVLRQIGVCKWCFTRTESGSLWFGSRHWAYQIVASLSLVGPFDLRAAGAEGLLEASWKALFPDYLNRYISDGEAKSSSLRLVEEELRRLEREWQAFVRWRNTTQEGNIASETESPSTMQLRSSIEAVRALHSERMASVENNE